MVLIGILFSATILLVVISLFQASELVAEPAGAAALLSKAQTHEQRRGRGRADVGTRDLSASGNAEVEKMDEDDGDKIMTERDTKIMENFKLLECDIVPVYSQILTAYGREVTNELVRKGVLPAERALELDEKSEGDDYDDKEGTVSVRLWPRGLVNNHDDTDVVVVPYLFDPSFYGLDDVYQTESDIEYKKKAVVVQVMESLAADSGVLRFVPLTEDTEGREEWAPYHLRFTSYENNEMTPGFPSGWSYVGYQGGVRHRQEQQQNYQELNLGTGCVVTGFVQHLLLHSLGLWHPNTRPDRDSFVTIVWENVMPGYEYDFRKRVKEEPFVDLPYDYASIMHFAQDDVSRFGNSTAMLAPEPIGLMEGLSEGDLVHLRLLYQCSSGPRRYADYLSEPCTKDCRCWDTTATMTTASSGSTGIGSTEGTNNPFPFRCNSNDALCQGGLVCDPTTDGCVRLTSPPTTAKGDEMAALTENALIFKMDGTSPQLLRYGVGIGILMVATVILSWMKRRSSRRDQYHAIPSL